jgi:hypothetical protein
VSSHHEPVLKNVGDVSTDCQQIKAQRQQQKVVDLLIGEAEGGEACNASPTITRFQVARKP